MTCERFKMNVFCALIVRDGGRVFLIQRCNTPWHNGKYACAGGSVDGGESVTHAMIREAWEELGIGIASADLATVHALHVRDGEHEEFISFFMEATAWSGEPRIMEPDKCSNAAWFRIDALPMNIIPSHRHVFDMVNKGVFYSEFGW